MLLKKAKITEFQSILDSGEFEIGDITCLVGKNEAGKTALLQALYRVNPIIENQSTYSVTDDYPRWDVEDYRLDVEAKKREHSTVASVVFELEDDDLNSISEVVGDNVLQNNELELSRGYDNILNFSLSISERMAMKNLIRRHKFTEDLSKKLNACENIAKAVELLNASEQTEDVTAVLNYLRIVQSNGGWVSYIYEHAIEDRLPKFLYFDEYNQMKGCANIEALRARKQNHKLEPSDYPLLGLINRARLNLDELTNPTRTRDLKNRLEGAGNHITKQVVNYWSQNRYLELRFDIRPGQIQDPEGMRQGTNIWCDVYDRKHKVTTELGTRSKGFVWFFSFLAWYGDIKKENKKIILLLDEPGLSLHAKAQEDLLRYFDAEVRGANQLIYTTHSPFMVDPSHFDRVRIVQDLGIDSDEDLSHDQEGTKVFTEVLDATGDSLFPLQAALGYEIYQTLFIGPNSLVVEGVSDLLYIQTISAILEESGRIGLSTKWTITPVGGADKVPTFVSLIGSQKHLNVAVLVDFQLKDQQSIENLYKRKLLNKKNVLTFADFIDQDEADIEDIFEPSFYISLVNKEYASSLKKPILVENLNQGVRILQRLEDYFKTYPLQGSNFNHYRPARRLLEEMPGLKEEISESTLDRFEEIFKRLNKLL